MQQNVRIGEQGTRGPIDKLLKNAVDLGTQHQTDVRSAPEGSPTGTSMENGQHRSH